LRYLIGEIREALFAVADEFKDLIVKAEAEALANFDVGNFEYSIIFCLLLILRVNRYNQLTSNWM
jgi:hypothetical protein